MDSGHRFFIIAAYIKTHHFASFMDSIVFIHFTVDVQGRIHDTPHRKDAAQPRFVLSSIHDGNEDGSICHNGFDVFQCLRQLVSLDANKDDVLCWKLGSIFDDRQLQMKRSQGITFHIKSLLNKGLFVIFPSNQGQIP